MSERVLMCSSDGCEREAVETLFLRNQPGHVHDCSVHAHDLREFCDVVRTGAIVNGVCPAGICTGNRPIWFGQPAPLEGRP